MKPDPLTDAGLRQRAEQLEQTLRYKAGEYRRYLSVPCRSDAKWHADEFDEWAQVIHDLLAAVDQIQPGVAQPEHDWKAAANRRWNLWMAAVERAEAAERRLQALQRDEIQPGAAQQLEDARLVAEIGQWERYGGGWDVGRMAALLDSIILYSIDTTHRLATAKARAEAAEQRATAEFNLRARDAGARLDADSRLQAKTDYAERMDALAEERQIRITALGQRVQALEHSIREFAVHGHDADQIIAAHIEWADTLARLTQPGRPDGSEE